MGVLHRTGVHCVGYRQHHRRTALLLRIAFLREFENGRMHTMRWSG
jgi:hypothetical protein